MAEAWTDEIVSERMAVDQSFAPRVQESRFSSQEWSLIMTATEFEIEQPNDPEAARIVANTENIDHVLPELEAVRSQQPMGTQERRSGGSGIIGALRSLLRIGDDDSYEEERIAAERLTQEYATALQEHLESTGRWESVRRGATE